MTLTLERIQTALAPRAFRYYRRVDSTNDIALDWLRHGAAPGSVVIADEQLRGRGRLGRTWRTPAGVALAVSAILHPQSHVLPQISMLGALAIAEMCEHVGLTGLGIKWPNDVQIAGRKVAGVLPEAVWDGQTLVGAVLGMGVNVRVDFSGAELAETATSIEPALGQAVDRVELLQYLLARVDYWSARLGSPALFDAWRRYLTTIGQPVAVGAIRGTAEGLDGQGALLVRGYDGALHRVIAGDMTLE